jgi:hypothetical protein
MVRNDGAGRLGHDANNFGVASRRCNGGYDSGATTVASPADSCDSLDSTSDIFGLPPVDVSDLESVRDSSTVAGSTLRSDYENVGRLPPHRGGSNADWLPEDSWKSLTEHVSGGGYQIRQAGLPMSAMAASQGVTAPHRANDYPPSDVDDYR